MIRTFKPGPVSPPSTAFFWVSRDTPMVTTKPNGMLTIPGLFSGKIAPAPMMVGLIMIRPMDDTSPVMIRDDAPVGRPLPEQRAQQRREVRRCRYGERQADEERDVLPLGQNAQEDGDDPHTDRRDLRDPQPPSSRPSSSSSLRVDVVGDGAGRRHDQAGHRPQDRGEGDGRYDGVEHVPSDVLR